MEYIITQESSTRQVRQRDTSLDILKFLLVTGMVIAHTFQFVCSPMPEVVIWFSTFINTVTFSGFFYVFGQTTYYSYLSRPDKDIKHKIIRTTMRLLTAYFICAFAYTLLIQHSIDPLNYIRIITFFYVPGYSEFLLTFTILIPTCYFFSNLLRRMNSKEYLTWGGVILLSTFIPYEYINNTHLGLIIGTQTFTCFPLLQYFPIYLLGQATARRMVSGKFEIFLILLAIVVCCISLFKNTLPNRFPPSIGFILLGLGSSVFYRWLSIKIDCYLPENVKNEMSLWGANTLNILVLSNLSIFGLYDVYRILELDFSFINSIISIGIILTICRIYLRLK